jgi:3-(3-hydroxy-phenyl)propionate hydroxylase
MSEQDLTNLKPRPGWQDPIVIVGAGPVGMSAALGLAHYGVPCVLLDYGEGPAIEGSRAIFIPRKQHQVFPIS